MQLSNTERVRELLDNQDFEEYEWLEDGFRVTCPFHDEYVPSLNVSFEKGVYHCFGCHAKGSFASLLIRWGLSPTRAGMIARGLQKEFGRPEDTEEYSYEMPEANGNADVIRTSRSISQDALDKYDLRFNLNLMAIVIPVHNHKGKEQGWVARKMSTHNRFIMARGMKVKSFLYGEHLTDHAKPVILVEAPLDVAYLSQFGVQAVAAFGDYLSKEQKERLRAYPGVLQIPDNDEPGMRFAKENSYNIFKLPKAYKDVGEVPVKRMEKHIVKIKQKLKEIEDGNL